jgi:tetratricopeptide (TPR) repeat protein
MRSLRPIHLALIGACLLTIVLLSFVSTTPSEGYKSEVAQETEQHPAVPIEAVVQEERSSLKPDQSGVIASLEQAIKGESSVVRRGILYDSLVKYLGYTGKYVLAAYYAEEKAKQNNGSGSDWMNAGERYRSAASFQQHEDHLPAVYKSAIACFEKALQLDPGNLDAQTGLGIAMVDGTNDPMSGIKILQAVDSIDSTHINSQLALADFAVRTQQYDKAIERYSRVLKLKPEYYAIHLSLAELYSAKYDTANVIVQLKAYSAVTDDPVMKAEIDEEISKLVKK